MIFISHSSKNHALAHAIADRLGGARYAHFLDLADLHGGDRWEARLHETLNEARALVVCMTPAALESTWVRKEVDMAIGRGIPVIPCALERCNERWHPELQWIDFTEEPAAGYTRLFAALERIPSLARTWSRDESPYPGLKAFEARHASVFFGRQDDLDAAVAGLSDGLAGRVRTFIGPSGVGKSSFVRAALLPRLKSNLDNLGSLQILQPMRPSTTPLRALAAALHASAPIARDVAVLDANPVAALEASLANPLGLHYAILERTLDGETCVLLVDQLEEALSATIDESDTFFTRLREAVTVPDSRLLLLFTLRSDFLTACLELPAIALLLRGGLHPLGVLDRASLRRAIVAPAAQAGVAIDRVFVEEVLDDTVDGRALPLLMDALARLWPVLVKGDVDAYTTRYRKTGRVTGGLEHRANAIYAATSADVQSSLQAAMLTLAEMDDAGTVRGRRAAKKDLPIAVHAAVEQFVSARLLVAFDERDVEYVEVAHEALFTSWPRYAGWLADAEARLKFSRRLDRDAREWAKHGESAIYLWTGERLAAGETMLKTAGFAADHPAWKFLAVSIANDRRMQEREANLIAARIDAEHQRLPVASLLAAAAAVKRYGPTPQLERAIRSALDSFSEIAACRHEGTPLSACLDPSGDRVVTCGYDGMINVFDAGTGELLHGIKAHTKAVIAVSVDRQGERILSASRDSRVKIWSLSTGELLVEFSDHTAIISAAMFDDSGTIVATASRDKTARVFDARSGKALFSFEHPDQVNSVDIAPDGRRIVTGCQDKRVRVFALDGDSPRPLLEVQAAGSARWHPTLPYIAITGQADGIQIVAVDEAVAGGPAQPMAGSPAGGQRSGVMLPPTLGTSGVSDVQFDQAGTRLLAVCSDATAKVFDLTDGHRISELTGHEGDMVSARFAPGGAQVLTAARDGVARLYDVESGILIREFRGAADALHSARFNASGERMVTASADGFVRVYRARPSLRGVLLAEHAAPCTALAISPTGNRVVAATEDGCLLVVELGGQTAARSFHLHERPIQGLDVSPDGRRAVTQPQYESAKVVDLATGVVLYEPRGIEPNRVARFLPNGHLVVADWRGRVRLYDQDYRRIAEFGLTERAPAQIDVSPDGEYLAMASIDGELELFNARGKRVASRKLGEHSQAHHVVYRPDGLQLACTFGLKVFLLDPKTLDTRHEVEAEGAFSIRYQRGGYHLILGCSNQPGSATVFDSNTGVDVLRVPHRDGVEDAAFSHDGRLIVTGGADRSVRVFDARTGQPLWQVFEHRGRLTRVEFGPADDAIFTASTDGTIRRFEFSSLDNLIAEARRLAGRELSDDERSSYGFGRGRAE